jgi:hypothetical protein
MDAEAKCKAELDAAVAALKDSNRLLMRSILSEDAQAIEKQTIRLRASRWKLRIAIRAFKALPTS